MSIAIDAKASLFVADRAEVDEAGLVNALGIGRGSFALGENGQTPPMTIVALVNLPGEHIGKEFLLAVELRRPDTGDVVEVPDINGAPGPVRMEQVCAAQSPVVDGQDLSASFGGLVQYVLTFPAGIPLAAGVTYRWFLEIDGRHDRSWTVPFHVTG